MCCHRDILINIFSYRWHIAHSTGVWLWGRNNAMQQQIICAFKWESLEVMATICICLENLMEESALSEMSHVVANHFEHCKDKS